MLDYLETGLFRGHPAAGPHRRRASSGQAPPDRAASGLRRLATDRRVLAVAAVVAVALAILAGTAVPLRSTQASPGHPPASPRSPGGTAAPSPTPSASRSAGSTASPRATASPGRARPGATRSAGAGGAGGAGGGGAGGAGGGGAGGAGRAGGAGGATSPARAGATVGASPAASATATRRAAQPATAASAVVVTFSVTSQGGGFFEGQVKIVNDGSRPLASWQVSVALPGDTVVAVAHAAGFVIHGFLLLEPASGAAPVPAGGGVLDVIVVAAGSPPVSGACTYNQTPCS
jgi:hypothetical protein